MGSVQVPLDSDGFVVSFDSDSIHDIEEFMHTWGFVCVHGCLSPAECEATLADCWSYLEQEGWRRGEAEVSQTVGGVERSDPSKWEPENGWPAGMAQTEGIIGEHITWTRRTLLNRCNPVLHRVFSHLLREPELLVSHDRYGFFRPAGSHPTRGSDRNLHFDCNPWTKFGIPVENDNARSSAQDTRGAPTSIHT